MMTPDFQTKTQYRNLLDHPTVETGKPDIEHISQFGTTQFKRVVLKAGSILSRHSTAAHVLVIWLRGKARFEADGESYVMHPGSVLEMPAGTPHGAEAETDCVFAVLTFKPE